MAYTPTEWKDGDIITAERLNKLEAGSTEPRSLSADFHSASSIETSFLGFAAPLAILFSSDIHLWEHKNRYQNSNKL